MSSTNAGSSRIGSRAKSSSIRPKSASPSLDRCRRSLRARLAISWPRALSLRATAVRPAQGRGPQHSARSESSGSFFRACSIPSTTLFDSLAQLGRHDAGRRIVGRHRERWPFRSHQSVSAASSLLPSRDRAMVAVQSRASVSSFSLASNALQSASEPVLFAQPQPGHGAALRATASSALALRSFSARARAAVPVPGPIVECRPR